MEVVEARNEHGVYCVPASAAHRPAARAVMSGKVYEAGTIRFIAGNADGGDIVHAGTFFGDFLPALAKASQTVWAFEPNPENFACAQRTVEMNALSNVKITHAGLSDRAGMARMRVLDEEGRSLGGASTLSEGPNSIEVPVVRLDDIVPQSAKVSVLHLDVEGHEAKALSGASETIRRNQPIIILETDVAGHPALIGYRKIGRLGPNVVYSMRKPKTVLPLTDRLPKWPALIMRAARWRLRRVVRRLA